MLGDIPPAFGGEGIGAQHEAIGEGIEGVAPGRVHLAATGRVAAKGQVGPQRRMAPQQGLDIGGCRKAAVGPQDAGLWVLAKDPFDCLGVAVQMQQQAVVAGELDHPPHDREIGIGTIDMELADRGIAVACKSRLKVRNDRGVAHPGADLAARAIGAQRGHDQVGGFVEKQLRAVVG